jgi:hypothetical protein
LWLTVLLLWLWLTVLLGTIMTFQGKVWMNVGGETTLSVSQEKFGTVKLNVVTSDLPPSPVVGSLSESDWF